MKLAAALVLATAALAFPGGAHAAARSDTICVGPGTGCVDTLMQGLAIARDGDTIRLAPGTYDGGVTITRSIRLIGAGPSRSIVQGGGPVVTVAADAAGRLPHVSIERLTLTGGRTIGPTGYESYGGGLYVPHAGTEQHPAPGATVRLVNVTVSHSEVTADTTYPSPSGVRCPGPKDCPFARGRGGGIASFGHLTLVRSRVLDNTLVGRLSDAEGAGVFSALGDLTVIDSSVSRNRAVPSKSIARFAEGGGLFVDSGTLTLEGSAITHNAARLRSTLPIRAHGAVIEMSANGGGMHVGGEVTHTVIGHSHIDDNSLVAVDPQGEPVSFDPGVLIYGGSLRMSHTTVARNHLRNVAATDADGGLSGSAMEVDGKAPALIVDSTIIDNTAYAKSTTGPAGASNGLGVYAFWDAPHQAVVRRTVIARNTATAVAPHGLASVVGVGVINNSLLRLDHVHVVGNVGEASGQDSAAQGGGIWNGVLLSGPPITFELLHSVVTGNTLTAADTAGGGVYTQLAFTRTASTVSGNSPDQVALVPAPPMSPSGVSRSS